MSSFVLTASMTDTDVAAIGGGAVMVALQVAGPILVVALVVGLVVSVFQAVTQIQEQTLTFIPKLMAIVAVIALGGPWMMQVMLGYTEELFRSIPTLVASR
jgi:flagellar biosynthesis protein FliQ